MKSIMQTKKECYVCRELVGTEMSLPDTGLEMHHIFGGTANRKLSEKYGLKVWLYRFTDCNGVECSAIWLDDTEMCWDYTEKEQELIDYWEGRRMQL